MKMKKNSFCILINYYDIKDFMNLHELTSEDFDDLIKEGHIVKSSDGFVWINVV